MPDRIDLSMITPRMKAELKGMLHSYETPANRREADGARFPRLVRVRESVFV